MTAAPVWIDTHVHLDAAEFAGDVRAVVERAWHAGVRCGVIPSTGRANFRAVQSLAHRFGWPYALGIHPLYVGAATDEDLPALRAAVEAALPDPLFVAIGEIGLDFFVADADRERQAAFYQAQLRLAREFDLPVLLHVRKSQDALLAELRRAGFGTRGAAGIAHAFNGSTQQAQAFVDLGFALGFGGAMTFDRARNIRRLAAEVPDAVPVLETDAPDIPPIWLYRTRAERTASPAGVPPNSPAELPRIAGSLAELRGWTLERAAAQTTANALRALPRLAAALDARPMLPPG